MNSTALFRASLELKVGGVVRGEKYGAPFYVARYGVGWWLYWKTPRLEMEYAIDETIGIHLPVEDLLWQACCGNFEGLSNRRVRVMVGGVD